MVSRVKNHVPFYISLASTRSYVLSLDHRKNLARSRSSRFSLATARSPSRLQVYPENHILEPKITTLSCIQQKLWQPNEF